MDIWQNIDKFKEKKEYNKNMIKSIEEEIQSFSNDFAELKRIKTDFFSTLLRQGFDIR